MVKDKVNVEVSMVFNVKVFGKVPRDKVDEMLTNTRISMTAFEMSFNQSHLLRMHVNEGDPL